MQMLLNGYTIKTTPEFIVLERQGLGEIRFAPGHTPALRHLAGIAARLEGAKVYPSPLRGSPFEILFRTLKGKVEIEVKKEEEDKGICLSFGEFDEFIRTIDEAFKIFQNEMQLAPQRPRRASEDISGSGSPWV